MYESFFGLTKRPFCAAPRPDQYFPAEAIENARKTLSRCLKRAEGVGVVIGPTGTGKTMLCRLLAEQFQDAFRVVLLASGHLSTRRALLQAILFELGRPYRKMDEGELRLALSHYALHNEECEKGLVLLVDEAHTLPLRLLEEIRVITNLMAGGQPRVRSVLAGGSTLEERLASPKLEAFSQRLAARCYLEPFDRCQTQQFIHAQIAAAGGEPEKLFAEDACRAVYQATDGIPRLVNQVCDHALVLALAGGQKKLTAAGIEEAWADLQQLPTPWNEESDRGGDAEGNIIEFGRLDEEPEPAQPSAPRLRVSPHTTDGPQIATNQQATESKNEIEFRPAGTIGPEVELVFPDPGNPFSEEFEEEEVVADPAGKAQPTPTEQPDETSAEQAEPAQVAAADDASELAAAINELRREAPGVVEFGSLEQPEGESEVAPGSALPDDKPQGGAVPSAHTAEAVQGGEPPREVAAPPAQDPGALFEEPSVETGRAAVANLPEPSPKTSGDLQDSAASRSGETPHVHAREPLETGTVEDEDLIVVEEEYRDEYPSIRPIAAARRQEYRQLFARLRRG